MRWRKTISRIASLNSATGILHAAGVVSCVLLAFLTACKPQPAKQFGPPDGRYKLKGEVISVDKTNRELVIKHEDIPGLMAAMTMPYPVKNDKELNAAAKGDLITADVVVQNGEMWLENVQVTQRSTAADSSPWSSSVTILPA
jgi:protein SCO1